MDAQQQSEQQDSSVGSRQLQSVDKPAAQPQYASFGVQALPDTLDAQAQLALSLKSFITVGIIKIVYYSIVR